MKARLLSLFLSILLLFSITFTAIAASGDTIVYITETGEKYHRYGCQYLWNSQYSISLQSAVNRGYTPCSKCNPPTLTSDATDKTYTYSAPAINVPKIELEKPQYITSSSTDNSFYSFSESTQSKPQSSQKSSSASAGGNSTGEGQAFLIMIAWPVASFLFFGLPFIVRRKYK